MPPVLDYIKDINRETLDSANSTHYMKGVRKGLSRELVCAISSDKKEPAWMLEHRLKSLQVFYNKPLPTWGPDLSGLHFDDIIYYAKPGDVTNAHSWEDVPADIKRTFEKLGIPEAERKYLAGAGAQYESKNVYHKLKEKWSARGVIFEDMDSALQLYPDLVRQYFMKCVPMHDHKFAALHGAVWSGGTFIYIPANVDVNQPLQAYFRMNASSMGQFEHTLIIVEKGAQGSYIEGCLPAGTLITSNPGQKPIEEIKPGDKILTDKGRYRHVKHVQKRPYTGTLYTIHSYGNATSPISTTREHPFVAVRRKYDHGRNAEWKTEWIKAEELRVKDYMAVPVNRVVCEAREITFRIPHWIPQKKQFMWIERKVPCTKDFFRLIGYYLAEGSVSGDHYLNFSFGTHEGVYIDDVENLLKKLFGITKVQKFYHRTNNGISVVVNSSDLARLFSSSFGKGAENKSLPHWALLENFEKQKELIKGYFRGDGNYYKKRHASGFKEIFRINTISKTLAFQIRDMLLRLSVVAFVNKRDRRKEKRKTMYTIGVSGAWMNEFGSIVDVPANDRINFHARASMFGFDGRYAFFPIKKILKKKVKNLPVYNFSVEEDESYVASSLAVHNCSAAKYETPSIHAGLVEIFVQEGARFRYSSVENWSRNTYNLNTKRAIVEKNGVMEWVGGNMGSGFTMLYPCSILKGEGASADHLGIAFANTNQIQDTGAKVIHAAPNTTSKVVMKSLSKNGGKAVYRGLLNILKGAKGSKAQVKCDALILDERSVSDTVPNMKIAENDVSIGHEATVGKISEEQMFYAMSRGLSEDEAMAMIVNGFIEPIVKAMPLEYAVEMNRLIELEMETAGAVG